jgi:hypothetical protein
MCDSRCCTAPLRGATIVVARTSIFSCSYAFDEGRVLVDRDGQWPARLACRGEVGSAARRLEAIEHRAVERSWQMLVEDAR